MALDLTGSWAKLDWAIHHIDYMRGEIAKVGPTDAIPIPLGRKYESDKRAVVWRIRELPKLSDELPLTVGDIIHNFRCALDYLAWQLAIEERGREPTDKEATGVQFPIETDPARWHKGKGGNPHLTYMLQEDVDRLEPFQPFKVAEPRKHGLYGINIFSNQDKHRFVHVVLHAPKHGEFLNRPIYFDCKPRLIDGKGVWHLTTPNFPMAVHDEIIRIEVIADSPNADIELKTRLTSYVAFSDRVNVLESLEGASKGIAVILKAFESTK